jgi:hypothetical protein
MASYSHTYCSQYTVKCKNESGDVIGEKGWRNWGSFPTSHELRCDRDSNLKGCGVLRRVFPLNGAKVSREIISSIFKAKI